MAATGVDRLVQWKSECIVGFFGDKCYPQTKTSPTETNWQQFRTKKRLKWKEYESFWEKTCESMDDFMQPASYGIKPKWKMSNLKQNTLMALE